MHGARPLRSTRRIQNIQQSLPKWYHITNQAAEQPTLISIFDEIGMLGVSAGEFLADLSSIKGDIECHISSPGGDIFDGIAIFNTLKARQGNVHVIVDGLAASAASFIAQAASPGMLEMAPHATMMIHDGFAMVIGNSSDLVETAALLDKASDNIAGIYADRTGKPASFWRQQMQAETWYSDQEAVDAGLADRITGQDAPAASWDLSVYSKYTPSGSPPATEQGNPRNTDNGGWQQRDGKWVFDPDNDGDDDGSPEGDTDNDYWDEDGTQLKAIPPDPDGKQGKPLNTPPTDRVWFPVLNADVDNTPWDAGKAWSGGAKADDPAAFYRGICAGRKTGDPATQAAWALPYKYSPASAPNAAGVRAAIGRLPQTQGLTNADEAKKKLHGLMKEINPDWEPDGNRIDPVILKAALPVPGAEVDHSGWDPAIAWAAGAQSDDPAAYYKGICAARRPGDPADQAAWALPYKYTPAGPPNAAGVRDALARLPGMRGLTSKDSARTVLEKALRQVDPNAGAPDENLDTGLLAAVFALGLEGAAH